MELAGARNAMSKAYKTFNLKGIFFKKYMVEFVMAFKNIFYLEIYYNNILFVFILSKQFKNI